MTDSGALRKLSANDSGGRSSSAPSAPATSTAPTTRIVAPGRIRTKPPIDAHTRLPVRGLAGQKTRAPTIESSAGSNVRPAATVTAVPTASTGPIVAVAR